MSKADDLIQEGIRLLDQGDASGSLLKIKEALADEPQNEDIYYAWRNVIRALEKPEKELAIYRKSMEDNLDSARSEYDLGRLLMDLKHYHQANQMFKRAIEREEKGFDYVNTYIYWGYSLDQLEEYQKAIGKYRKATELDPLNEMAYSHWRNAIKHLEDPEEEIKAYQHKIETSLRNASALHDFGYMLIDMKNFPGAIEAFQKAYELNEEGFDYTDLLINWGFCLDRLKDFTGAIEKYRLASQTDGESKVLYTNWHAAILNLEQPGTWIDEYLDVIEHKFATANGFYLAGYLLTMDRQYDRAIGCFEQSLGLKEKGYDYTYLFINWGYCLSNKFLFTGAIEKYKQALASDPDNELAMSNWAFALDPTSGEEKLNEFRASLGDKTNNAHIACTLGIAMSNTRNYDEALAYFEKAIRLDPSYDDSWYYYGNTLLSVFRYESAMEAYQKTLALSPDYVFAAHNHSHMLEKLGRFKISKEEWRKTLKLYQSMEEIKFKEDKDSDFFLYYGSIHHEAFKELDEAEALYLKGLQLNPENVFILLNLVKLYLARKNDAIESGEETGRLRNQAHTKAWNCFRLAEKVLTKQVKDGEQVINPLTTLGELYLSVDKIEQAREVFQKANAQDKENLSALTGLGVVNTRNENYKEAMRYFREALVIDPDNLTLQTNLAESLLRSGSIFEAEKAYNMIQGISSYHIESLIGLAEIYKKFGDMSLDRGIQGDAEEMYNQADYYYNKVLDLAMHPERSSKKLTVKELSGVYYSKGYVNVKMFELNKAQLHLITARSNFKKVSPVGSDFYKARRAISKIDERTRSVREASSRFGSVLIIVFSCILLLAIQWAFFIGKPVFGEGLQLKSFESIDATTYGLLTFGALIFIAAGMYLREITKLKFGVIEMEKSSFDQVSTTTSLEISKGSSDISSISR